MRAVKISFLLALILIFSSVLVTHADHKSDKKPVNIDQSAAIIWQQPDDISQRNLFYGEGGEADQPAPPFQFVKINPYGTTPKIIVKDAHGTQWNCKFGEEAQPETVATHLLWAVGYFTDETYYMPILHVNGVGKLKKPMKGEPDAERGEFTGARMEKIRPEIKTLAYTWDWFNNPFVGKREFNGLKIMMAMINNWDLKPDNNKICTNQQTGQLYYQIDDLGASFGKTGRVGKRSKGNLDDYAESKFIRDVSSHGNDVDLVMHSKPMFLYMLLDPPYWLRRAKMEKIAQDIPISDAKWVAGLMSQLSERQLRDAFRAGGYNAEDANMFAQVLRSRIVELQNLPY